MNENFLINVTVCVDSPIFTRGLVDFIGELYGDKVRIVTHPADNAEALLGTGANIIILDGLIAQPVLESIPSTRGPSRVILVSEKDHAGLMPEEQVSKICAYFPARAEETSLRKSLDTILQCLHAKEGKDARCKRCPHRQPNLAAPLPLTPRELEIFELVGRLHTNAEIAESLQIANKTLESHYSNIKRKLRLSSSREMLKAASDWVDGR